MQLQLKHLPIVFLAVAAICLAGAFSSPALPPEQAVVATAQIAR
jgi:hypothetical protein